MERLQSYYQNISPDTVRGGYSDIRMWPCYIVLCLCTLFFARWLGLFSSFSLVGMPAFIISLKAVGMFRTEDAPINSREVYAVIEQREREHERQNRLLRRNTKIRQEDEAARKKLKKSDKAFARAKRA